MFGTIVAGCDGRDRGRGAVSLAHAIATATGAKLLLVGVNASVLQAFPGSYASARHELERDLRAVREELAPEALVEVHADMSAAHALRHVAAHEQADLVVVGSRHRRRLRRIAESDHAMQVLHGAPCAVAIAPDPLAPRPALHRIGVGIDATPESAAALRLATDLARRTGAALRLVAVADEALDGWVGYAPILDETVLQELADQRAADARGLLEERLALCQDVDATGDVVVGNPAGEIVLATEDLDLLVLGSRRWGPVKRLALGSTSERVIRHTACPVLVPPRGAGSAQDEHAPVGRVVAAE
jgi:nucleotide-binding universal stress UspA family protein